MQGLTHKDIAELAGPAEAIPVPDPMRKASSWEITTFLLPVSVGHFRRVLRDNPDLPQGTPEGDSPNAMRWFSFEDVAVLRGYFDTQGRKPTPSGFKTAPVIGLIHPFGGTGKTTALLHLAMAAALSGQKVLVIDADPAGDSTRHLAGSGDLGFGVLPLIARSYGGHLLRANQLRLDQGETPQPMEETISQALGLAAQDVIRPSRLPGLDLIAAPRNLALADLKIGQWQGGARSWQPWRALHDVIHRDGLAEHYDVIFCDTGGGLGPLSLSVAASCDVLVMPVALGDAKAGQAVQKTALGLQALAGAVADIQTRENHTARALGQAGMNLVWGGVHLLLQGETVHTRPDAAALRARFGAAVLPDALPDLAVDGQAGALPVFYDLPPRAMPRARYTALRRDVDACWAGLQRDIRLGRG